jgi:hypothetical protein
MENIMNKLISTFLLITLSLNAFAAPMGVSGQNQSNKYPSVIKVPNNLATDIGSSSSLLETGSKSILANPSFEHSTFSTSWTSSAGTLAAESSTVIDGKKSLKATLSSQAVSISQDSTLYAAQFADGIQGLAMMRVKTTISSTPIYVCPRQAGSYPSQVTSGCVQVQANGKWGLYKVPFILGATSNGIGITSNGVAVTGDIYVDDAFVGAVDLKQDVDQSRIAGASYFAGAASCTWTRTNTAIGAFTATAACPGPTIEDGSMGTWQTTDSDLPRQTITNLPKGKFKATFYVSQYNASSSLSSMAISDGTTVCKEVAATAGSSQGSVTVSCVFNYTSAGDRSFELYGASGVSTITIDNRNAASINSQTKFILEYFGSGSTYSSNNANYSRTSFVPVFQGITTSATDCYHSRDGQFLDVDCKVTVATSSAVELRIGLPIVSGTQLNSATSSGTRIAGHLTTSEASSATVNYLLIDPQVSYFNIGTRPSATSTVLTTKMTGSGYVSAGSVIAFTARIPINEWADNSNIIIGQFNGLESCTNSAQCETEYYADISSTGVVSGEEIDFINGNCALATNTFTCTYNTSQFTQAPTCSIKVGVGATQSQKLTETASGFSYSLYNSGGTLTNVAASVSCRKRGSDYVTKTARAVASDQNIRTPGTTGAKICSFDINLSGDAVTNHDGNCLSSLTCTDATGGRAACTFNSTYWTSAPKCSVTDYSGPGAVACKSNGKSTTTLNIGCWTTTTGAGLDTTASVLCHGYGP